MAYLDAESERRMRFFFAKRPEVVARRIRKAMHVTVYHARRPLRGLAEFERSIDVLIPLGETRLMVLAPGGENQRDDIDPTKADIGLRIRRGPARTGIEELRAEFYPYEAPHLLGRRAPSTPGTNAFGARHYQPHLTILRAGGVTVTDLRPIGEALRGELDTIRLDRLVVELRQREQVIRPGPAGYEKQ